MSDGANTLFIENSDVTIFDPIVAQASDISIIKPRLELQRQLNRLPQYIVDNITEVLQVKLPDDYYTYDIAGIIEEQPGQTTLGRFTRETSNGLPPGAYVRKPDAIMQVIANFLLTSIEGVIIGVASNEGAHKAIAASYDPDIDPNSPNNLITKEENELIAEYITHKSNQEYGFRESWLSRPGRSDPTYSLIQEALHEAFFTTLNEFRPDIQIDMIGNFGEKANQIMNTEVNTPDSNVLIGIAKIAQSYGFQPDGGNFDPFLGKLRETTFSALENRVNAIEILGNHEFELLQSPEPDEDIPAEISTAAPDLVENAQGAWVWNSI